MRPCKDCWIFHLTRLDGRVLVLHALHRPKALRSCMEQGEVCGRYASEPGLESLRTIRSELVRLAETTARRARAEARFTPTFLLSAAVFLVAYFLFSLLMPDPIPMIDEAALGILFAAAAYVFLTRRDARSEAAVLQRKLLVQRVDGIVFTESVLLVKAQKLLQGFESPEPAAEDRGKEGVPAFELEDAEVEEAASLLRLLEGALGAGEISRIERRLQRGLSVRSSDYPLYALARTLREGLAGKTGPVSARPRDSAGTAARQS